MKPRRFESINDEIGAATMFLSKYARENTPDGSSINIFQTSVYEGIITRFTNSTKSRGFLINFLSPLKAEELGTPNKAIVIDNSQRLDIIVENAAKEAQIRLKYEKNFPRSKVLIQQGLVTLVEFGENEKPLRDPRILYCGIKGLRNLLAYKNSFENDRTGNAVVEYKIGFRKDNRNNPFLDIERSNLEVILEYPTLTEDVVDRYRSYLIRVQTTKERPTKKIWD